MPRPWLVLRQILVQDLAEEELCALVLRVTEEPVRLALLDDLSRIHENNPVGDDVLRLIFVACHPVLSPEARVALTLKMVGGLATPDIARAFLLPEATLAPFMTARQAPRVAFSELIERGMISASDPDLLHVVDDAEAAVDYVVSAARRLRDGRAGA